MALTIMKRLLPAMVLTPLPSHRIMRIFIVIPLYSIISFLGICIPSAMVYLHPWLDVFQSLALVSFFLLICEFVAPTHDQRDMFFTTLAASNPKSRKRAKHGQGWYRVSGPCIPGVNQIPKDQGAA